MAIEFKISRDPHLLQQYYQLREECFREELGIPDFDGSEEERDKNSLKFLAIENGKCIGGARISSELIFQSQIKRLEIEKSSCCMWERFAFHPSMRKLPLMREFCVRLNEVSWQAGFHNAVILSPLPNARLYRLGHSTMGVEFNIHRRVPHCAQSPFAGIDHYFSTVSLRDLNPISTDTAIAHKNLLEQRDH